MDKVTKGVVVGRGEEKREERRGGGWGGKGREKKGKTRGGQNLELEAS